MCHIFILPSILPPLLLGSFQMLPLLLPLRKPLLGPAGTPGAANGFEHICFHRQSLLELATSGGWDTALRISTSPKNETLPSCVIHLMSNQRNEGKF